MIKFLLLLLAVASLSIAQDNSAADRTIPFSVRSDLPGTCKLGQVITRKDLTPGSNVFICGSANDWHAMSGGGVDLSGVPATAVLSKQGGVVAGDAKLIWDNTTHLLSVGAGLTLGAQDCASYLGASQICITASEDGGVFNAVGIVATSVSNSSQGIYILSTSANPDGVQVDDALTGPAIGPLTGFIANIVSVTGQTAGTGIVRSYQANSGTGGFEFGLVELYVAHDDSLSDSVSGFRSEINTHDGKSDLQVNAAGTAPSFFGGPIIETLHTPASSSEACTAGQFTADANFHYVCTSSNVWKRVALSSF